MCAHDGPLASRRFARDSRISLVIPLSGREEYGWDFRLEASTRACREQAKTGQAPIWLDGEPAGGDVNVGNGEGPKFRKGVRALCRRVEFRNGKRSGCPSFPRFSPPKARRQTACYRVLFASSTNACRRDMAVCWKDLKSSR
jgi:hypothetical protein